MGYVNKTNPSKCEIRSNEDMRAEGIRKEQSMRCSH